MPPEIAGLTRELLKDPATVNLHRRPAPAAGITQAVYPVGQPLKAALLLALLRRGDMKSALVFTRTKHRANRVADWLARQGVKAAKIHGNRSQSQRTQALEGFKAGRYQALVATDIAARGIDVEALGHVVNFDVPLVPDDYIHRVGRTGRAEATGEAFTFVAPEEEASLRAIERAVGKPLPRVILPDFDYKQKPEALPPSQDHRPPPRRPAPRRDDARRHPAPGRREGYGRGASRGTRGRRPTARRPGATACRPMSPGARAERRATVGLPPAPVPVAAAREASRGARDASAGRPAERAVAPGRAGRPPTSQLRKRGDT